MWPFSKTEHREGYTDAILGLMLSSAQGSAKADPRLTGAASTCAGLWGRSFAGSTVKPGIDETGLNPSVLHEVGSSLVTHGESVWLIEVENGAVVLVRAGSWDITGRGTDSRLWRYRLEIPGPDYHQSITVPGEQVFHPKINANPVQPHKGISPLTLAGFTATALANTDQALSQESGGPSGYVLPAPLDNLGEEAVKRLADDLKLSKGRTKLVPSMLRSWGEDARPAGGDWTSKRIGANPPDSLIKLRNDTHEQVLAALGVPPSMFATGGQASGAREAFRQFIHSTIQPIPRVIESEARAKLNPNVSFDFRSLSAADIQGRARSFKSLVDGGMSLADAAAASGILLGDD